MDKEIHKGQLIENRYQILENVGEGGMSIVYRAKDKVKKDHVAMKFLKPGVTSSYIEDRIRFKKEVEVISKFNHPHIIKVYSMGEYNRIPYIVMELLQGESLLEIIARGKKFKIKECIEIINQVVDALRYVHLRGIIHRDLKPANIMLVGKRNEVKLLDFGLAFIMELSEIKDEEEILGTFGYMSPEATGIVNKPLDERSDLYSLGIMFYRLVTGELPFKGKKTSEILHKQVAMIPHRPGVVNKDLPKELDDIIMKLLEKEPDLRYQSTAGLIHDLEKVQKGARGFVIGTHDQKVKLTYRVRLVGRKKEYDQLTSLFNKAREQQGSLCLISGEPGIGKSRLVEELRTYAYEHQGLFFVGKCFDQENKMPYQPFKDILDQYIRRMKHLSKTEREEETQRLKTAMGQQMGEIAKLNYNISEIFKDIPSLERLDTAEKENVRFRMACARFFSLISKEAMVLFLDDLQWADEGSLNLLEEILKIVNRSSVLILGTYRDTEVDAGHSLSRIKKGAESREYALHEINLKLLNYERMRNLVSEVLGESEEKAAKLTRYIMNKTMGNTFFAITLLRELVERKALVWRDGFWKEDWNHINKIKVSANIIDMLLQRIREIPEDLDVLLRIGSIIGKEFDMDLLYKLMDRPEDKVVDLIDKAIDRQLLEQSLQKGKVVFVHDRIKEAFYAKMGERERKKYHLSVGRAFEEKYSDRTELVIFDLAHHFIEGRDKEKALKYSLPAAEKAQEKYANREAIKYYGFVKRTLEKSEKGARMAIVLEGLGDVQRLEGLYDDAMKNFKHAIQMAREKLYKAKIYEKMGVTLFQMGQVSEAIRVLESTLKFLNFKQTPRTPMGAKMSFVKEMLIQNIHMIFEKIMINEKYKYDERRQVQVKILLRLGYCYYFNDIVKSGLVSIKGLNIVDKMKDSVINCHYNILMAPIFASFPNYPVGEKYLKKGLQASIKIKNRLMEGFAYTYFCYLYCAANRLDESVHYGRKALNTLLPLGEKWEIAVAYSFIWWSFHKKGDLEEAIKISDEFYAFARLVNEPVTSGWAINVKARNLFLKKEVDNEIFDLVNEALIYEKQHNQHPHIVMVQTSLSFAYLQKGFYDKAIKEGEEGIRVFLNSQAKGFWSFDIFTWTAEAYLRKIEMTDVPLPLKENYFKRIEFLLDLAFHWGKKYRIFYGAAFRLKGKYLWLKGEKGKSIMAFNQALRFAEKNKHLYDLALVCYEMGRYLFKNEYNRVFNIEKGRSLLCKAGEILERMGNVTDLKKVRDVLGVEEKKADLDEATPRERLQLEREMTTVLDTITFISSILDLDNLLEKVIDKAMQLSGAERGILFLYPEDEKAERILKVRVIRNVKESELEHEGFNTSRGIINKVEMDKRSLIVEDATMDEKLKEEDSVVKYGLRSVLCIPIMLRDDLLGLIYLDNRLVSGLFNQENLRVLEVLAKQAGISISNAILYRRAITDGLTGLYNHNFFQNYLMKCVDSASRFKNDLSLLMIDIDHFKICNDTYGHHAGDLVLKEVADVFRNCIRKSDLVARYGGEEFVVILPQTDMIGARKAAEKIRKAIEELNVVCASDKAKKIKVTVSIGVSQLESGEDRIKLIEKADRALYKAKETGRNCIRLCAIKKPKRQVRRKKTSH
ncbi:MAG: diguanylate cyclase [Spirochaetes bacterium]|nr:diguanylate cyclase [Spirochaetota bacterium]